MWHWQQYLTCSLAVFVIICFTFSALLSEQPSAKLNLIIQLAIVCFGQYVLYSGGWYN